MLLAASVTAGCVLGWWMYAAVAPILNALGWA